MENMKNKIAAVTIIGALSACNLQQEGAASKGGPKIGTLYMVADSWEGNTAASKRALEAEFPEYNIYNECDNAECVVNDIEGLSTYLQYLRPDEMGENDIIAINYGFYAMFNEHTEIQPELGASEEEFEAALLDAFSLLQNTKARVVYMNLPSIPLEFEYPDVLAVSGDYRQIGENAAIASQIAVFDLNAVTADLRDYLTTCGMVIGCSNRLKPEGSALVFRALREFINKEMQ